MKRHACKNVKLLDELGLGNLIVALSELHPTIPNHERGILIHHGGQVDALSLSLLSSWMEQSRAEM
jgi:hypothetical protein